ncbi:antitoxin [Streptomyces sp. NPDC047000]|uniref:antitoxin n=1 Tax=Streptomyces sp. NPDC047000 TaxID=3155474 RepID=UPI0033F9CAC3
MTGVVGVSLAVAASCQHPGQGVEGAERLIDERTGDRYDAQTDKAADAIRRSYRSDGTTER